MNGGLNITVVKKDKECVFYADIFAEDPDDICQTANEITFRKIQLYEQDDDKGLFSLPIDKAKKLAEDVLSKINGGK